MLCVGERGDREMGREGRGSLQMQKQTARLCVPCMANGGCVLATPASGASAGSACSLFTAFASGALLPPLLTRIHAQTMKPSNPLTLHSMHLRVLGALLAVAAPAKHCGRGVGFVTAQHMWVHPHTHRVCICRTNRPSHKNTCQPFAPPLATQQLPLTTAKQHNHPPGSSTAASSSSSNPIFFRSALRSLREANDAKQTCVSDSRTRAAPASVVCTGPCAPWQ